MKNISLSKTDKWFIFSNIIILCCICIPLLLIYVAQPLAFFAGDIKPIIKILYFLNAIILALGWFFVIPICYFSQIVTLIMKLRLYEKSKKDYIIIWCNLISLVFGVIIIFVIHNIRDFIH